MMSPLRNAAMPAVNLIAWDNGVGLSRDLILLGDALTSAGASVSYTRHGRGKLRKIGRPIKARALTAWQFLRGGGPRFDFNIMLEHIWPEYLPWARHNAFIPNPEWCNAHDLSVLPRVSSILAKTHEAERIFAALGCSTRYIGFTSEDRFDPAVARERAFFHLAGRSQNKGTEALLALWRQHPEWPTLTVVQNPKTARMGAPVSNIRHIVDYLDDAELKRLQNAHLFHLCPSETEGFGHYLVEAMGIGAVALTLDAPPMNELIHPGRGMLVPSVETGTQHLATTWGFTPEVMAQAITTMANMDDDAIAALRATARSWYLDNAAAFPARLIAAITPPPPSDTV